MSMSSKINLSCPKCATANSIIEWQSINADVNPEMRIKILDGSAFLFRCTKCAYTAELSYPCLYHDMTNSLLIFLMPDNHKDAETAIKEIQISADQMKLFNNNYKQRIVTSPKRLVEKIRLLESGIDDKLAEICKLLFRVMSGHGNEEVSLYYDTSNEKHKIVIVNSVYQKSAEISETFLIKAKEVRDSILLSDNNDKLELIDEKWAINLMEKRAK